MEIQTLMYLWLNVSSNSSNYQQQQLFLSAKCFPSSNCYKMERVICNSRFIIPASLIVPVPLFSVSQRYNKRLFLIKVKVHEREADKYLLHKNYSLGVIVHVSAGNIFDLRVRESHCWTIDKIISLWRMNEKWNLNGFISSCKLYNVYILHCKCSVYFCILCALFTFLYIEIFHKCIKVLCILIIIIRHDVDYLNVWKRTGCIIIF